MTPVESPLPLPDVSVVVCVYNEAGNGAPLVGQIERALSSIDYELIYVNDGSTDATLAELRALTNPRLIVLDLPRNYGQSPALAAGIDAARGAFVVTLDGDQQNDPADMPRLLQHCQANDLDLVTGWRVDRRDGFWLRKVPSRVANGLIRWATDVPVHDLGCGLKVMRAELAKNLGLYGELHRFLPVLAQLEGARIAELPVSHRPRRIGQSKYGLGRTFRVLSDLLLLVFLRKYARKPMHLFGTGGLLLLGLGLTAVLYRIGKSLLYAEPVAGWALTAGLVLVVGGLQFLSVGIVAEMQLRTRSDGQARKPYRIRRIYRPVATTKS